LDVWQEVLASLGVIPGNDILPGDDPGLYEEPASDETSDFLPEVGNAPDMWTQVLESLGVIAMGPSPGILPGDDVVDDGPAPRVYTPAKTTLSREEEIERLRATLEEELQNRRFMPARKYRNMADVLLRLRELNDELYMQVAPTLHFDAEYVPLG
jgi:hypothetical protein